MQPFSFAHLNTTFISLLVAFTFASEF